MEKNEVQLTYEVPFGMQRRHRLILDRAEYDAMLETEGGREILVNRVAMAKNAFDRARKTVDAMKDLLEAPSNPADVTDVLMTEHRALQYMIFDKLVQGLEAFAAIPDDQQDDRNRNAVSCAKRMLAGRWAKE